MYQSECPKKPVKKKATFVLKDIDVNEIEKRYGFHTRTNDSVDTNLIPPFERDESVKPKSKPRSKVVAPKNTTNIDDLDISKKTLYSPFLDQSNKHHIVMIDYKSKQSIQSRCCFWDRHPFETLPIGCPIRYVPSKTIELHTSEITKEKYTTYRHVSRHRIHQCSDSKTSKHIQNDYYETDGCFCSFNCCMAFIIDNIHNPLYSESIHLLVQMSVQIFGAPQKIHTAPSWRLIDVYGGFMSIADYRKSFTMYLYVDNEQILSKVPKMVSVGHVFEEHIIF